MKTFNLKSKLFMLVASAAMSVQAETANVAPTGERFLLIVETSAATQKRADNVQKVVGSVIAGGLKGEIAPGNTIGLWTFSDQLHSGQFPLQEWTDATRQRVALAMVQFVQQQKFEKAPRLAAAWEAATNIVARSEHITVLLVTSGAESVTGTPFDAEIAESFLKNSDEQLKNRMPFLTILRAVKGKFVAFAVNMPPWPLEVPEYPAGLKPLSPPPPVEVPTTTPAVTRRDPAMLSPTNVIRYAVAEPTVVPPPPPPASQPVAASQTAQTPTVVAPPPLVSNSPPVVAAQTPTQPEAAVAPTNPASEPAKFPIVTVLVAGICLLLGIMVVFIALLRWTRRSVGESLITRSMSQEER